ncbi:MAG: prepilin-type N-terminal cleavage/methylation domain-containing protein [Candidatus Margulisbacteria bacterium]|nr:prepilin-type N-terminal cleavage/methylation domain-containing protein [Candidatus Margulisiibacteriota bacterium]MBU1617436.1 prepilin-type N-terminal cleavage/methylation domain-containing protein [Candidatus Margulisiibacteriota bacterium]MBU1867492.1 prepilin-type N-terminal cleavage/methylation domain-containing protein [Candidatus Margulisiibacteriota bacterium]
MSGRKGFTLIEALLAISLLAAIIPTIILLFSAEVRSADKIIKTSLKRQAESILAARLTRELRSAASQTIVSSKEISLVIDGVGSGYVYEEGIVKRKTAVKQPLTNAGEIDRFVCKLISSRELAIEINKREIIVCKK